MTGVEPASGLADRLQALSSIHKTRMKIMPFDFAALRSGGR
jgi:hypothetical protein